ncbi:MAG: diacylglycerol kinase family protein [Thomasclavelia sp.]|nr:diacylglycerol kinase family protein [Thomasclavelia sp.]
MKNNNFIDSFKYAFQGIYTAIKNERNMKVHVLATVIVTIMGFIFNISGYEWIMCLLCFGLVISLEMINTAIEAISNVCATSFNPQIKVAKDVAAGAVLVSAIVSAIIGFIIFLPKIF